MVESNYDEERRSRIENMVETLQREKQLEVVRQAPRQYATCAPVLFDASRWPRLKPLEQPLRSTTHRKARRFSCTCV